MSETKDLNDKAAIEKLKQVAEGETAMFCTYGEGNVMAARPMAVLDVTDDGVLWFFSARTSEKNKAIASNPLVSLLVSVPGRNEYVTVQGKATIGRDKDAIDKYWNMWAKSWFPEGKDDPDLTTIMVTAFSGHYWDNKTNRMVQLAKVAVGAVIGKTLDDGVEGQLRV